MGSVIQFQLDQVFPLLRHWCHFEYFPQISRNIATPQWFLLVYRNAPHRLDFSGCLEGLQEEAITKRKNDRSNRVYTAIKIDYLEYTKMEIALSCRAKGSGQVGNDFRHRLKRSSILRVKHRKCCVVPINLYTKVMPGPMCERSWE